MKIKLYKLLEMIDKGEKLPEKIKVQDNYKNEYKFEKHEYNISYGFIERYQIRDYWCEKIKENLLGFLIEQFGIEKFASLEIEIIEEIDKVIKPLEINENEDNLRIKSESGNWLYINSTDRVLAYKINEIIKYINKEE